MSTAGNGEARTMDGGGDGEKFRRPKIIDEKKFKLASHSL